MLVTALLTLAWQAPQNPVSVPSTIQAVTVYPGAAAIRRQAQLGGPGAFLLPGLPASLDPDSVRVRLADGEVVSVEVRDRYQPTTPDERIAGLRERLSAVQRELRELEDEAGVLTTLLDHVQRLLRQEEGGHAEDLSTGRPGAEAWEANFRYLAGKLKELKGELRALEPRRGELEQAQNDLRLELGRCEAAGGVQLKDLLLDVVGPGGALEVEYVVSGAGWEPFYDLRAAKDLSSVELAYRAKVFQQTGEDWLDAEIALSTAQPRRGAQGPEPRPIWISLSEPGGRFRARVDALRNLGYSGAATEARDEADRYVGPGDAVPPAEAVPVFAQVESQGLSVRFVLPRRETIESRREPTTVLVGRADLGLEPEHYCVPALDTTVWVRGRARNTTDWVLLPGRAAVSFGADLVGHARLDAVQPGQELTLHLGADPGLTLERTQLGDRRQGPGMFSSRTTQVARWRFSLENNGAFSSREDGSVDVIVQEALPRSRDERLKVSLEDVSPALSKDERWDADREEKGVVTWLVRVPRDPSGQKEARIEFTTELRWPEDLQVVQR
jgi:uncharacterized protein (TIGR02231 family)